MRSKQRKFFAGMWRERSAMEDDPLMLAFKTVLGARYSTQRYMQGLLNDTVDDVKIAMDNLKGNVITSESSRKITYRKINRDLSVHAIYSVKHNVPELERISFTRFRIASHSLAVEVGRWSRRGRGRLPVEERLCSCGNIQTEEHVVQYCQRTQNLRECHNFSNIDDIFSDQKNILEQCKIIHKILCTYY